MSDDLGLTDGHSAISFNAMNDFEVENFDEQNLGPNNLPAAPEFNDPWCWLPFADSSTPWTQSPCIGNNSESDETQICPIKYAGSNDVALSPSEVSSNDVLPYLDFSSHDSIISSGFEDPNMITNNALQQFSAQGLQSTNSKAGTMKYHSTAPQCIVTQHIDPSVLKKRKASEVAGSKEPDGGDRVFHPLSVLNILFKYTQDLTTTQIEKIAEDTGYPPEFVFNSYIQYRNAARSDSRELARDLTGIPSSMPAQQALENDSIGLGKSCENKISGAGKNANKNIRHDEPQDEELMTTSGNGTHEKPFQCTQTDCNTRFSRQGEMKRHCKKHRPGEFPCTFPNCGEVYYRKDKFRQHWSKKHESTLRPSHVSSSLLPGQPSQPNPAIDLLDNTPDEGQATANEITGNYECFEELEGERGVEAESIHKFTRASDQCTGSEQAGKAACVDAASNVQPISHDGRDVPRSKPSPLAPKNLHESQDLNSSHSIASVTTSSSSYGRIYTSGSGWCPLINYARGDKASRHSSERRQVFLGVTDSSFTKYGITNSSRSQVSIVQQGKRYKGTYEPRSSSAGISHESVDEITRAIGKVAISRSFDSPSSSWRHKM